MYILHNQKGYFLARSGEWVDGREPAQLFKTQHHDAALNQLFEVNNRDVSLRITVMNCAVTPKGLPIIPADPLPAPQEKTSDPSDPQARLALSNEEALKSA